MLALIELNPVATISLLGASSPRVVNEDLSHYVGGDAQEVCAAVELPGLLADQPQVRLVDEGRALQSMAVSLLAELMLCEAVKLLVYNWNQSLQGGSISGLPSHEQRCNRRGCLGVHG